MTDKPLTPKQEAFCQSYARYGNATRAAKEGGYSAKTAHAIGHKLLMKAEIEARIAAIKAERFKALHMSADEALAEIAKVARFNMKAVTHITPDGDPYIDLNLATEDDMAALAELSIEDFTDGREVDADGNTIKRDVRRVKVKAHNKIGALTLVARAHGLLTDKVEHSASDGFVELMREAQSRADRARKGEKDADPE